MNVHNRWAKGLSEPLDLIEYPYCINCKEAGLFELLKMPFVKRVSHPTRI